MPSTLELMDKIGRSMSGATDIRGNRFALPEAVASSFGVKLKPQDVELNFEFWRLRFQREERELAVQMWRLVRDKERKLVTEKQYNRELRRLLDQKVRLQEKAAETLKGQNP